MKKVSIIVPVYDVEKYLKRCVKSILKQTYSNLQIILVDDGSPDSSPGMCDDYAKQDNRVEVIHKVNGGLGYARNTGLEMVKGDYIVFIDSDDFVPHNYVEYLVDSIEQNGVDACISGYNKVDYAEKILYQTRYNKQLFLGNVKEEFLPRLFGSLPNNHDSIHPSVCGIIFKSECILANNIRFKSEREVVSEDLVFEIELFSKMNSVQVMDDALYNYCNNENTLSQSFSLTKLKKQEELYEYIKKYIKENNIDREVLVRFQKLFMIYIKEDIRIVLNMYISRKEKNALIRKILEAPTVLNILKEYPIKSMAMSKRIFMNLVKAKKIFLLKIIVK